MDQEDLLEKEQIEKSLSPHPLSFMKLQALCIFLIVWGVLVGWLAVFSSIHTFFDSYTITILVWASVMILVGIIASLLSIRWSILFLFVAVILGGIGIMFWLNLLESASVFIPFYMIAVSIVGFLMVELYRRSHKYIISNQRIVFKGGILTKEERTLRYDKVSDINSKQGILGQIFGFGTIIPISSSGFGLGSDNSFAAGGISVGEKKARFFGLFGGGKEVQTPRARSYYELHGVFPFKEVKRLVEGHVQGSVATPYLEEQSAFQEQQVNLQKEMRDLLKKQKEFKNENDESEMKQIPKE